MENKGQTQSQIKKFLEQTLARNNQNIIIICENIHIPENATVSADTLKNRELQYSSFIRTSDSPIFIRGDFVVIHRQ